MQLPRPILACLTCLALGYLAGQADSTLHAEPAPSSTWRSLSLFADVYGHIQRRYVESVDEEQLVEQAIRGMMASLDPHSRFLNADEFAAMRDDTRGEYVGVGIEIEGLDGGGVRVLRVMEGGPAASAGVLAGDRFVEVNGNDATTWSTSDVVQVLRGPRGEPVDVVLERTPDGEPAQLLTLRLVRDVVQTVAVTSTMPVPGYGVITVRSFQAATGEDVRAAVDRLETEAGGPLRGLVLDLRSNPGGLLSQAISVSDAFLSEGVIVTTAGRQSSERESWSASRNATRYRGPLVVLVNRGTASASEIVAGALQDHRRAVVVGEATFGKGSVQSIIELAQGAGMKLTVSLYYTPLGRSIQGRGILPDLEVESGQDQGPVGSPRGEARLDRSLAPPSVAVDEAVEALASIRDRPLRVAIEQLRAFEVFSASMR
jgi:carboxyl-terminal processing protease